ncbi:cupin domain-containing protein, partial [Yaniella flava]|uniref:cupin domain-containing protein n=1 Tax=Yaniella flava TaxID=287930 RepID=UPI0031E38760
PGPAISLHSTRPHFTNTTVVLGNLEAAQFKPMMVDENTSVGEISWIKDGRVQFWRGTQQNCPQTVPYPIALEETVYVIEGNADVEFEDGTVHRLNPGDVATFEQGAQTTWTFIFPFVKVAIFADAKPAKKGTS